MLNFLMALQNYAVLLQLEIHTKTRQELALYSLFSGLWNSGGNFTSLPFSSSCTILSPSYILHKDGSCRQCSM